MIAGANGSGAAREEAASAEIEMEEEAAENVEMGEATVEKVAGSGKAVAIASSAKTAQQAAGRSSSAGAVEEYAMRDLRSALDDS